jgi:hypothetical protein
MYDVFLSYNSADRDAVLRLKTRLEERGLSVFVDVWELRPGFSVQKGLSEALENSKSVAIVVGPHGIGRWQDTEIEDSIAEQVQVRATRPVIPVLLPGVSVDSVPRLLRRENRIDFGSRPEAEEMARLVWGITGVKPAELQPAEAPKRPVRPAGMSAAERAVNTLNTLLRATNITFFVGGRSDSGEPGHPPSNFEIARRLWREAIEDSEAQSVLFPIDLAASWYAIQFDEVQLEDKVGKWIAEASKTIPPSHVAMARLLSLLRKQRRPRGTDAGRQLIVTTDPDTVMERALLREGLSFTRVVQSADSQALQVSRCSPVADGFDPIGQNSTWEELTSAIDRFQKVPTNPQELLLDGVTDPVLYKLRGSYDCFGTSAISAEQYLEFHRRVMEQKVIPETIRKIIQQTPLVLLNYSFLDPDFGLAWYALIEKCRAGSRDPMYALHVPPLDANGDGRVMLALWDRLKETALEKKGITTIEEDGELFLGRLISKVQQQIELPT